MSETPTEDTDPQPQETQAQETEPQETQQPVRMTKDATRRPPGKEKLASLPLPNSVKLGMVGLGLVVAGVLLRALVIYSASTDTLRKILIHANSAEKKPKKNYGIPGDKQILKDLHALKTAYVPLAILTVFIVAFLIYGLRRPRSASGSRWVLIVAMLFPTGVLFGFYSPFGFPPAAKVAGYLMSVGAVAAIVLMFVPTSAAYFKACRDAALPPGLRGQPRPRLFGPRPAAPAGKPASSPSARPATTATGGNRAKSKARSDAEAVARGAELARSRARANKSRRTDA